jgi:hypothetical protein
MLRTTISTKDPETGADIPVSAELLHGVSRASELLEEELDELPERFGIAANWQFRQDPAAGVTVALRFTIRHPRQAEVGPFVFSPAAFKDDETIRNNLRPWMGKLNRTLSGLIGERMDTIQKQLRHVLEALSAIGED